jgi:type IV secretion system protein VirB9
MIYTNFRVYSIELTSYEETYMAGVRWRYSKAEVMEMSPEAARKARAEEVTIGKTAPEDLNFDYGFVAKEVPEWMPLRVYDDGAHVYIQFPPGMTKKAAPVLFIRSRETGDVEIVNFRQKGDTYIVDRLFDVAELRLGQKHPVVVGIEKCAGGCD